MRLSEHWLKEWLPELTQSAEKIGSRLTMAGLELDGIESAAPAFSGIVVAYIRSVEPHPTADRLKICRVEAGGQAIHQVICGAPNVRQGMYVPFAPIGAVLPNDVLIQEVDFRGVISQGMLCSAAELGLAEQSEGLMVLPDDFEPGLDIRRALDLDDKVLEIDLTPNRADCLSILGVARELSALESVSLRTMPPVEIKSTVQKNLTIHLDAPSACPRYVGRVIQGVKGSVETPLWIRERLRRSGVRSIGPVVDVTNYVMLELGQPMHAFDMACLKGDLHVRMAKSGESLTLLNEQTVDLQDDMVVIADDSSTLAIAGIMGGLNSAVGDDTQDIFLESAFFAPGAITGRARTLGLHTDSSHRFERGVDPTIQRTALERATALLTEIAGGLPGPLTEVCSEPYLPSTSPILLRRNQIVRTLGIHYKDSEIVRIIKSLGCVIDNKSEGWLVTPPSHRFDLSIEIDLIEELARIYGYDQITEKRTPVRTEIIPEFESHVPVSRLRELLSARGYQEAITYSFIEEDVAKRFSQQQEALFMLSNPLSVEMAVMRSSLWPGLLKALTYNANRQQSRCRLFETGLTFSSQATDNNKNNMISGAVYGSVDPAQWGTESRQIDFFDVKGDVEALFALGGRGAEVEFVTDLHPALHPGQSARIERKGEVIGWLGMLSPDLEKEFGLERPVGLFEMRLDLLCQGATPHFSPLSRFPATRRDLAVLVENMIPAEKLLSTIRSLEIEELRELHIFDIYFGEGLPKGRKSVAFSLILQGLTSSLTDTDIEAIISRVIEELKNKLGAIPRG